MNDIEQGRADELIGRDVIDPEGDKIGTAHDLYLDNETGQPEWLAVTTGLFGTKVSFVPIDGVALAGDEILVRYSKDQVKDAPRAEADGQLSPDEENALYAHYGRSMSPALGTDRGDTNEPDERAGTVGHDTSGTDAGDAMTRSEEELDVSTTTRQAGTARLRKWIETEDVHITVPIRREKARLVVEPVTDANRDAALSGEDLTTEEHEITLSEEVVDVDKHVVPKERVRIEKDVETDEVTIDEQLRKERIAMDDDAKPAGE